MKKKLIVILIIILAFAIFIISNLFFKSTPDKNIAETVKKVEILDHQFSNYYITYNNYISDLQSCFTSGFDESVHYERKYIPEPINIKSATKEQLASMRKNSGVDNSIIVEISKVYNDLKHDFKYVFTKSNITSTNVRTGTLVDKLCITKRYLFVKENNSWKITSINQSLYSGNYPYESMKNIKSNNQNVQYVTSFNPLEVNRHQ
jgi:hypothetical protein